MLENKNNEMKNAFDMGVWVEWTWLRKEILI